MNRPMTLPAAVACCICLYMLGALSGCAWLRRDTEPKAMIPPESIKLAEEIRLARDGWPESRWWRRFNDPQLTALVEKALLGSPGLDVARSRAKVAQAKVDVVRSGAGPFVGAVGMINRMHVSDAGFLGVFAEDLPRLNIDGPWYTTATAGLTGSWNLDIWGKEWSQIQAAIGASNAKLAEEAQAELALACGVSRLYFDIQALYVLLDILEQSRAVEIERMAARKARLDRGLEPRSAWEEARLRKLGLDEQISNTENDLRALHEALRNIAGLTELPPLKKVELPVGQGRMPQHLGYELLARRPDLQAARWYAQSSLSAVDAVRAAFYPSFNLLAFYGSDTLDIKNLFRIGSQQFMFVPSVSLPIFDSGRLNANLKEVRAASDMAIAVYNEAVLNAVKDVAQAGIRMQKIEAQMSIQEERLKSAAFLLESATAYRGRGLADNVTAMEARLPLLLERGKALELRRLHLLAEIALIEVLGGGYWNQVPEKARPGKPAGGESDKLASEPRGPDA